MKSQREALSNILKDKRFTEFEKAVYQAICRIPPGETRSYVWVAQRIGKPGAARAVGSALNKNPFTGSIPCHRVIRLDGSIGGYSKGVKLKKSLLRRECVDPKRLD